MHWLYLEMNRRRELTRKGVVRNDLLRRDLNRVAFLTIVRRGIWTQLLEAVPDLVVQHGSGIVAHGILGYVGVHIDLDCCLSGVRLRNLSGVRLRNRWSDQYVVKKRQADVPAASVVAVNVASNRVTAASRKKGR